MAWLEPSAARFRIFVQAGAAAGVVVVVVVEFPGSGNVLQRIFKPCGKASSQVVVQVQR